MSIKEHLVNVSANVGTVTIIDTSRKKRPAGLRRPYEYVVPAQIADTLYSELANVLMAYKRNCQYASVIRKPLSRGARLDVFVLAGPPGWCEEASEQGITREGWSELRCAVQETLFKYLGKDARIYADRYSKRDKVQARIETYIAYSELLQGR